jgi:hypothetical protein
VSLTEIIVLACIVLTLFLLKALPSLLGETYVVILDKDGLHFYPPGEQSLNTLEKSIQREIAFVLNTRWGTIRPIGQTNKTRLMNINKIFAEPGETTLRIVTRHGYMHLLPISALQTCIKHDMVRAILLLEAPGKVLTEILNDMAYMAPSDDDPNVIHYVEQDESPDPYGRAMYKWIPMPRRDPEPTDPS